MSMLEQLTELLDPLDKCKVECDGFTRMASFKLFEAGINHSLLAGYVLALNEERTDDDLVQPHFWIEVEDEDGKILTVDYRLRMWVGNHAPHGVFYNDTWDVDYYPSNELPVTKSQLIFDILSEL